jgi:hypothetical protein
MAYIPTPDEKGVRYYGGRFGIKGRPEDKIKCIMEVSDGERFTYYSQCSRKRTVGEYCKQHDPVAKAARDKKQDDKYAAESARNRYQYSGLTFAKALAAIAHGHNDARTLALETLEGFDWETRFPK